MSLSNLMEFEKEGEMKKIKISGGFHRSPERTFLLRGDNGRLSMSPRQARDIAKHLCGIKGCHCGWHHGVALHGAELHELRAAYEEALAGKPEPAPQKGLKTKWGEDW